MTNTVHQFFVAPGRNFTVTIVKITPKIEDGGQRTEDRSSPEDSKTRTWAFFVEELTRWKAAK